MLEGSDTICAVDIGYHYRALGEKIGDTIEWYWIGSHQDYDKMLKRSNPSKHWCAPVLFLIASN